MSKNCPAVSPSISMFALISCIYSFQVTLIILVNINKHLLAAETHYHTFPALTKTHHTERGLISVYDNKPAATKIKTTCCCSDAPDEPNRSWQCSVYSNAKTVYPRTKQSWVSAATSVSRKELQALAHTQGQFALLIKGSTRTSNNNTTQLDLTPVCVSVGDCMTQVFVSLVVCSICQYL